MVPELYRPWPRAWLAHEHVVSAVWSLNWKFAERAGEAVRRVSLTLQIVTMLWSPLACGWHLPILNWEGYPLTKRKGRNERKVTYPEDSEVWTSCLSWWLEWSQESSFPESLFHHEFWHGLLKRTFSYTQLLKAECWVRLTELISPLPFFPSLCVFQSEQGDTLLCLQGWALKIKPYSSLYIIDRHLQWLQILSILRQLLGYFDKNEPY